MKRLITRVVVVAFGILLACGAAEIILRVFPELLPDRRPRNRDRGIIQFTLDMGDVFNFQSGYTKPPTNPKAILSEHRLVWDGDGFRVPARPADHYDIVVVGDSYVEGATVAQPWPDLLAERTGLPVRNLGFRGYGPFEESEVIRRYALGGKPRYVIWTYYEGNDLEATEQKPDNLRLMELLARSTIEVVFVSDLASHFGGDRGDERFPYHYPVRLGNGIPNDEGVVFQSFVIGRLNGDYDDFAHSSNMAQIKAIFGDLRHDAERAGVCLLIAYAPCAPHIYLPYVVEEDRAKILHRSQQITKSGPGEKLKSGENTRTYEEIVARLGNHHRAVADMVAELGYGFIDLLPAFQQAAARGEQLYYTHDTHWNQAGNHLAAEVVAGYLAANPQRDSVTCR